MLQTLKQSALCCTYKNFPGGIPVAEIVICNAENGAINQIHADVHFLQIKSVFIFHSKDKVKILNGAAIQPK